MNLKKIPQHIKMYDGRKYKIVNSLLNQAEMKLKNIKLYSKPISITIETTNRCIFKCEMCPRSIDKIRKEGDMSLDTFHKIEPLLRSVTHVNLSGFGETLLNQNFFHMLRTIKNYNCYVMIYTNGYLLTPNVCDEILNNKLDEIVISIDGVSQNIYENIRKRGDYSRLINNINTLNDMKKIRHTIYPTLNLNFMAMDTNITDLPTIIDFAHKHNFKHINIDNFAVYSEEMSRHSLFNHMDLANKYMNETKIAANNLGVDLSIPCFDFQKTACYDPFMTVYITWDGKVTTCANQTFVMGDINLTDFIDIWNDLKYQKLRKRFIENDLPDQCKNCFMHTVTKYTFVDYPQKLIKDGLEGRIRYDII